MPHRRQLLAASSTDAVAKLRDTQHRNDPFRCTFTPPLWPVHHAEDHVVAASCICFFRKQAMQLLPMPTPNHYGIDTKFPCTASGRRSFGLKPSDDLSGTLQRQQQIDERSGFNALGFRPGLSFLFAGRWSAEKRIHLLIDAMPQDCGLIIVGDSDADYADEIEASGSFCLMAFCQAHMTGKVRITSINRRKPNE